MFLQCILCSATFLLIAYIIFRVIVKKDYKRRLRLSHPSYLTEILVFAIHANMFYLARPATWPYFLPLPENLALQIASMLLFGTGLIVLLISWFDLGTKPGPGRDKNKLKTGGLYKYSRNTQLTAYGLMLVPVTLLFFPVRFLSGFYHIL